MATSFGASAASVTENAHKSSSYLPLRHRSFLYRSNPEKIAFRLSNKAKLRLSSKGLHSGWNGSPVIRAQLNEVRFPPLISFEELFSNLQTFIQTLLEPYVKVAVDGSSKAATSSPIKSEASPAEATGVKLSNEPPPATLASEESLSEFITQVKNLVKLVDSNDIVELQLKQLDCELHIRKKEALPPPPSAPITYFQSQPQAAGPPPVSAPPPMPTAAASPVLAPSPVLPKAQPPKSSHPPLKSPMAGTFYRSPAPGEPAFVKVGDKVQKGQVLCIIEAMKLMNEIEADQSGTLAEIVAEDGKPVSVDTPLFVIAP